MKNALKGHESPHRWQVVVHQVVSKLELRLQGPNMKIKDENLRGEGIEKKHSSLPQEPADVPGQ